MNITLSCTAIFMCKIMNSMNSAYEEHFEPLSVGRMRLQICHWQILVARTITEYMTCVNVCRMCVEHTHVTYDISRLWHHQEFINISKNVALRMRCVSYVTVKLNNICVNESEQHFLLHFFFFVHKITIFAVWAKNAISFLRVLYCAGSVFKGFIRCIRKTFQNVLGSQNSIT